MTNLGGDYSTYGKQGSVLTVLLKVFVVLCIVFSFAGIVYPSYIPQDLIKISSLLLFLFLSSLVLLIITIKQKKLILPTYPIYYVLSTALFFALISSIFSGLFSKSLIGYGYEYTSAGFIIALLLFSFVLFNVLTKKSELNWFRTLLNILAFLFVIFHLISSFPNVISSKYLLNLVGSWSDTALISGLVMLLSAINIVIVGQTKNQKILSYVLFILSLILTVKVGYLATRMWIILGVISVFTVFVYYFKGKHHRSVSEKNFFIESLPIFVIILASIIFIISPIKIQRFAPNIFLSNYVDEIPSSYKVDAKSFISILKSGPILGVGPNVIQNEYLKNKPKEANYLSNWNIDEAKIFGSIPTIMVSTGIIGIILWLLFAFLLITHSIKDVVSTISSGEARSRKITIQSAIGAFTVFAFLFVNTSGVSVMVLFIIMLIIYMKDISFSHLHQNHEETDESSAESSLKIHGMFAISVASVILFASCFLVYLQGKKAMAAYYFVSASEILKLGDIDRSLVPMLKAANISGDDIYYQSLSNVLASKLKSILLDPNNQSEEYKKIFEQTFIDTVESAKIAIQSDPLNYKNYVFLGNLSESSIQLGIKDAYSSAKSAYTKATELAPNNPVIYLYLARLEALQGNLEEAKKYVNQSIELKSDLPDAIIFLAKLHISEKNNKKAIEVLIQGGEKMAPRVDFNLYLLLGSLLYDDGKYQESINLLSKIIALEPAHSDARYFIGLSFAKLGDFQNALLQFKEIQKYNGENEEIKKIISDLEDGRFPRIK